MNLRRESAVFLREVFSVFPKLAERQHLEILDDLVSQVEAEICGTLLNSTQVPFFTSNGFSNITLVYFLVYPKRSDRKPKYLPGRTSPPFYICSDGLTHNPSFSKRYLLK
jgi:hypothetical protein